MSQADHLRELRCFFLGLRRVAGPPLELVQVLELAADFVYALLAFLRLAGYLSHLPKVRVRVLFPSDDESLGRELCTVIVVFRPSWSSAVSVRETRIRHRGEAVWDRPLPSAPDTVGLLRR